MAEKVTANSMRGMVHLVRLSMRDFPELNRLIDGEESSGSMIQLAVVDTIDDFNTTPPLLGTRYTVVNFPSLSLLRKGATAFLLQSVSVLKLRNLLTQSGGAVITSPEATATQVNALGRQMYADYATGRDRLKRALNMGSHLGISSDLEAAQYDELLVGAWS